ncbi:MAG: nucleotidyl transferase AbiEii/AbiGii toxin family protein, partial [Prevotella sp.]|nr:nucleotidyl transferase AbiEii/AbiGii toxin family protein [Prevotella sp.]
VYRIADFAVHGGTAINLFYKEMPRYSVDIDITYIPLKGRDDSLQAINVYLIELKQMIEKTIPGIRITHKPDVWKLLCLKDGATVKIEVNGTKRGIIGTTEDKELCLKAQIEFSMICRARTVSFSQLYGGKISAALSRQHPRDLFDCKYMPLELLEEVKDGLFYALLGSDKPIVESLQPNLIDQKKALEQEFEGMTDIPFSYTDYESTRLELISDINHMLSEADKEFLLSFESGEPEWDKCCAGDLRDHPSVKWKLQNILKLKASNPKKFAAGIEKLRLHIEK